MKHKLQTLLKHKLQWLLLLAALLGVSQGAFSGDASIALFTIKVYYNGSDHYYNVYRSHSTCTNPNNYPCNTDNTTWISSTTDLGEITSGGSIYLRGYVWRNNTTQYNNGFVRWWVDNGSTTDKALSKQGDYNGWCNWNPNNWYRYDTDSNSDYTVNTSSLSSGTHYIKFVARIPNSNNDYWANNGCNDCYYAIKFTVPQTCTTPTSTQYPMTNATVTYNGSSQSPTITPATGAGTVATVYYNGTSGTGKTSAGTYAITVDVNAGSTYCAATGISLGNFVINKKNQSTLTISNSTTTYCKNESVTLTTSGGSGSGAVSYAIVSGGTGAGSISGSTLTCSTAGTIKVRATKAASTNYNAATSATKTFTFKPLATASQYTMTGTPVDYDGSSHAPTITPESGAGTVATVYYNGTSGTGKTDAGTYAITVDVNASSSYCAATGVSLGDFVINKIAQSTLTVSNTTTTYCQNDPVTLTTSGGSGTGAVTFEVVSGGTGAGSISGSTLTCSTAGTIIVRATKAASTNYNAATSANKTFTFKPLATASQYTMTGTPVDYDGTSHAPTITPESGAGTVATVYYKGTAGTGKTNAGTYAITVDVNAGSSYCAATGISLGNFVINKIAQSTLTVSNTTTTYCQNESVTLTSSGGSGTGAVTFEIVSGGTGAGSISGSTLTCSTAGTIKVRAKKASSTNYKSATSAAKIFTFKPLATASQYTMTGSPVDYDGTSHAPTITPESGAGSVATVYYNGTSGTGKTDAGTYAITVDVNAGSSYCAATGISLGNFVINKIAQSTLTVSNTTTTYCQNESVTLTSSGGSGDGAVTFEVVSGGTGAGSISGSTLTCTTAGTIIVRATKAASTNYNAATSATKTFTFKAKPTITKVSPAGTIYNYMPVTFSTSSVDASTWTYAATGNLVNGYFSTTASNGATFKGKVVDGSSYRTATISVTGTNGCVGSLDITVNKDTETCP